MTNHNNTTELPPDDPLSSGLEYQKLAEALHSFYQSFSALEDNPDEFGLEGSIYFLSYVARVCVLDRIEIWKWGMDTPINVPIMPAYINTLGDALFNSVMAFQSFAESYGFSKQVEDIFRKGDLYFEVEAQIPAEILNSF